VIDFDWPIPGQLSDCRGLAAQKRHDFVARLPPRNRVDVEEATAPHQGVRTDLHEALSLAQ
jgi:hypothetical protein